MPEPLRLSILSVAHSDLDDSFAATAGAVAAVSIGGGTCVTVSLPAALLGHVATEPPIAKAASVLGHCLEETSFAVAAHRVQSALTRAKVRSYVHPYGEELSSRALEAFSESLTVVILSEHDLNRFLLMYSWRYEVIT